MPDKRELLLSEESLRRMPFSLEAEQSILGLLLIDPERMNDVAGLVRTEDFYMEQHRHIYEAMRGIFLKDGHNLDVVTLIDELVTEGTFDKTGGDRYLGMLVDAVPDAANLDDYIRIVREKALLRRLIEASAEISDMAYTGEGETRDILDRSEQLIFNVAEKNETKNFVHIRDALQEVFARFDEIREAGGKTTGLATGFSGLDRVLLGMGKGDLVIIGARPGMGKTSFALNIASNVAKTGKTVCVFSLEMSAEQLVSRVLSSEACVENSKMRTGMLDENEWRRLGEITGKLAETNILIDDTTGITVTGMKGKLRRVKNLGLIVVDYLQLMQADRTIESRVQEVSVISRGLKLLGKEFGVPVICCAQLNRATEKTQDKMPQLSDLRDSGSIEQDADVVLFLHREGYYKDDPDSRNIATCIVAKNRHGETRKVKLGWRGEYTRFETVDDVHDEP